MKTVKLPRPMSFQELLRLSVKTPPPTRTKKKKEETAKARKPK